MTSSPIDSRTGRLNPANGLLDELKKVIPCRCRVLLICSDPDGCEKTDFFAQEIRNCLKEAGFSLSDFWTLDRRNQREAEKLLGCAELLILSGGHVPTQNRFFAEIGLRGLLESFQGSILGISAGSMNSADVVYAQPELPGEAADPNFQRFLSGLGLTGTMLLPHYQITKDEILDGMRLFEEITFRDSMNRQFFAIPDGSYLLLHDGTEELRGEAYLVENGTIRQIASKGDILRLPFSEGKARREWAVETERLRIIPETDAEMENTAAQESDPSLRQAYSEMLAGARSHRDQRLWYAVWDIRLKHTGVLAGDLSFKGLDPDGMAEIGYGMRKPYENQGFMTEAVAAMVKWAFRQSGVKSVEAETEPGNLASQRVMEKAGFQPTGRVGAEGPRFVYAGCGL